MVKELLNFVEYFWNILLTVAGTITICFTIRLNLDWLQQTSVRALVFLE